MTERQRYILRVRALARAVASAYTASREAKGFPLLRQESTVRMPQPARGAETTVRMTRRSK